MTPERIFFILLGLALILIGCVLFETVVALALIPVGISVMALGGT